MIDDLPEDVQQRMIAKLLGTKTAAEQFRKHEARKPDVSKSARIDLRRPRTFKPQKPILRFEYWERPSGPFGHCEWIIERYENGKLVHTHTGQDWQKRDALLIKLQASGARCEPVTVAGVVPTPIQGRRRDQRRKPSGRFDIMAQIGKLTASDLEENYD